MSMRIMVRTDHLDTKSNTRSDLKAVAMCAVTAPTFMNCSATVAKRLYKELAFVNANSWVAMFTSPSSPPALRSMDVSQFAKFTEAHCLMYPMLMYLVMVGQRT